MAGGAIVAKTSGRDPSEYNSRFTFYTFMVILAGATTGLLLGYDNGVMGGVVAMKDFQEKFFYDSVYKHNYLDPASAPSAYCKYDNHVQSLVISVLYLAALFAAIGGEWFARRYGRRVVMAASGVFFIAGAVIMAAATGMAMLIIGRILLGIGCGAGTMIGPVYLAEMAPAQLRGTLNVIFQLLVTIGILVASLINYGSQFIHPWGWRLPLALAGAPGIIILLAGICLPDSPNSLAERGHVEKAKVVLKKIRGVDDVEAEFADIVEAARQSNLVKHPYRNLMKRKYRPQLVISCVFMICQQFDGINAIIFYAPVLFETLASGSLGSLLNTVIVNSVNVLATFIAIAFVDKWGRRVLLMGTALWMALLQVIVAIVLGTGFSKYGANLPSDMSIGVLILICAYICGHAGGWGPIGWLYPTEIQPLETRAAGAGINTASNMLFTFVIAQSFTTMLCSMQYGVFLFFAGCVFLSGVLVYFMFPETNGVPVETAHAVFRDHPIWMKIAPEIQEVHAVDLPATTPKVES